VKREYEFSSKVKDLSGDRFEIRLKNELKQTEVVIGESAVKLSAPANEKNKEIEGV